MPPIVGGIIGWFTNWLAIKMLFRPLRERRLFGVRIPFTPGILPRGRARLASSIGDTVATELFTPEVLRARIASPDVRRAVERGLSELLLELGRRDVGTTLEDLSSGTETGPLGALFGEAWKNVVATEAFSKALALAISEALRRLESVPLSVALPPDGVRNFSERLLGGENTDALRASLIRGAEALLTPRQAGHTEGAGSGGRLDSLIPPAVVRPLFTTFIAGLYRAAVPGMERLLDDPALHRDLEDSARTMVHSAIERLGIIQRLFVGVAGYERKLAETMPETVADLVAAVSRLLRDPSMPGKASTAAFSAFEDMASRPLSNALAEIVSLQAARAAIDAFVDALRDHGPELAGRVAALSASRPDATFGRLMKSMGIASGNLAEDAARSVAAFLADSSRSDDGLANDLSQLFSISLARGLRGSSVGDLVDLSQGRREELAAWLADRAIDLVTAQTDRILAGIDIRAMVAERLESLEMEEVERIVLGIVSRELAWITALGGVLGAIIGLVQSLVQTIGR